MQRDAILTQLGYTPNKALVEQLKNIEKNTHGYEKIQKHIMDLHDHLKVHHSFVALSNSEDCFKIKVEGKTTVSSQKAHEKIKHFSDKFKITINKLDKKETYYIVGFNH
ncbi:MAG: hypothetical protein JKY28_03470 [Sulfurimonas sp.]|nr:hypothetical protein [Sulfurimonas sp.]PHQ92305.1 MAG: hypothetical protein COB42_01775 [Sulfurimonas sp.]